MSQEPDIVISVRGLEIGYDESVILKNINFEVRRGEVFVILGGSGAGKSTLLKTLIGLYTPLEGEVLIAGHNLVTADDDERMVLLRKIGVLYQGGALFGSMTLLENVRLPLDELTALPEPLKELIALSRLKLVGLGDAAQKMPSELSGGMQKRAGIARAMALDPQIPFPRRTFRRTRSSDLRRAGSIDHGSGASFRNHLCYRHPRAGQHLQYRRPLHHARQPGANDHRRRQAGRASGAGFRPVGAPVL